MENSNIGQSFFTYTPSFRGNLLFAIFFALCILPQLYYYHKHKTLSYTIAVTIGLMLETAGYVARLRLATHPFSADWFLSYLIFLTIAPIFFTAAIYLCLSRIVVIYGEHLSFLGPRTLAIAFMTSDMTSLLLQAAGAAVADTAATVGDSPQIGVEIVIIGLLLQVVSLASFLVGWAVFMLRVRSGVPDQTPHKVIVRQRPLFFAFSAGLVIATTLILIRSMYRVIELWSGFSGSIWNDEVNFMVLDGTMVALAVILLTVLHPGIAFGEQWNYVIGRTRRIDDNEKVLSGNSSAHEVPMPQHVARACPRSF